MQFYEYLIFQIGDSFLRYRLFAPLLFRYSFLFSFCLLILFRECYICIYVIFFLDFFLSCLASFLSSSSLYIFVLHISSNNDDVPGRRIVAWDVYICLRHKIFKKLRRIYKRKKETRLHNALGMEAISFLCYFITSQCFCAVQSQN